MKTKTPPIIAHIAYRWDIYNHRGICVMAGTGTVLDGCVLGFDGGPIPRDQMIADSMAELNARRDELGLPRVELS